MNRYRLLRYAFLTLTLFAAWVVYTQDLHPASLITGAVFAAIAAAFSYGVFYESLPQSRLLFRFDLVLVYFLFLLYQSISSSISLIYLMLKGSYKPGIIRVKTHLKSRIGRTLLANTISLVPGTLSLWMEGPYIFIHWFDKKTGNRVHASKLTMEPMQKLLERIFGRVYTCISLACCSSPVPTGSLPGPLCRIGCWHFR
jgi:multicomponent Na+:H+ antiporter subunit E